VSSYLLQHRHDPRECGDVFASLVVAETEADGLRLLPNYVAARTTVTRVSEVDIP
jgi:hypothetical protein